MQMSAFRSGTHFARLDTYLPVWSRLPASVRGAGESSASWAAVWLKCGHGYENEGSRAWL